MGSAGSTGKVRRKIVKRRGIFEYILFSRDGKPVNLLNLSIHYPILLLDFIQVFLSLFRQTWIPCLGDPFCEIFGGDAEACFCPGFPFFGFFTRGKDVFHGGAGVLF